MKNEFVLRGKTASDKQEILNFGGDKSGYAYRLIEFQIYPAEGIGGNNIEYAASITAAKVYEDPANPNFSNPGLIGTAFITAGGGVENMTGGLVSVVNDTFMITQDLIIAVVDTQAGTPNPVNWQCKFVAEKMNSSEEAVINFKQFSIFDD